LLKNCKRLYLTTYINNLKLYIQCSWIYLILLLLVNDIERGKLEKIGLINYSSISIIMKNDYKSKLDLKTSDPLRQLLLCKNELHSKGLIAHFFIFGVA